MSCNQLDAEWWWTPVHHCIRLVTLCTLFAVNLQHRGQKEYLNGLRRPGIGIKVGQVNVNGNRLVLNEIHTSPKTGAAKINIKKIGTGEKPSCSSSFSRIAAHEHFAYHLA